MMLILTTALRSMWSKAGVYLLIATALVTALLSLIASVSKAARTAERLKNATAAIDNARKAKTIEAEIDAMSATDARDKLRERWKR